MFLLIRNKNKYSVLSTKLRKREKGGRTIEASNKNQHTLLDVAKNLNRGVPRVILDQMDDSGEHAAIDGELCNIGNVTTLESNTEETPISRKDCEVVSISAPLVQYTEQSPIASATCPGHEDSEKHAVVDRELCNDENVSMIEPNVVKTPLKDSEVASTFRSSMQYTERSATVFATCSGDEDSEKHAVVDRELCNDENVSMIEPNVVKTPLKDSEVASTFRSSMQYTERSATVFATCSGDEDSEKHAVVDRELCNDENVSMIEPNVVKTPLKDSEVASTFRSSMQYTERSATVFATCSGDEAISDVLNNFGKVSHEREAVDKVLQNDEEVSADDTERCQNVMAACSDNEEGEPDYDDSGSDVSELDALDDNILDFDASASTVEIDYIEKICRDDENVLSESAGALATICPFENLRDDSSFRAIMSSTGNLSALELDPIEISSVTLPSISDKSHEEHDGDYDPSGEQASSGEEDVENITEECTSSPVPRSLNESDNTITKGARDDSEMFVKCSDQAKRKKSFCYYCKTLQSVISRHLEEVHKNEPDVKKFADLPKGNDERKKIIDTLRCRGNYLFNTNKLYNQTGELIVTRRPHSRLNKKASDYRVCHNCRASFSKKSIRHHRLRCIGDSSKRHRTYTILSKKVAGKLHETANARLRNIIFPVMREDEICRLIRYDELLISFGNKMVTKYEKQQTHDMIRARLRLLGRLLRELRKLSPEIVVFTDVYSPKHYNTVIKAINIVAQYNEETNQYGAPSVASALGNYLKKVGKHLVVESIKKEDHERIERTENFLKVHDEDFCPKVNKMAVESTSRKNRQQKKLLPTMDDITKLRDFLSKEWKASSEALNVRYTYEAWLRLLQVTLISMLFFNRRRAGECERIEILDFNNACRLIDEMNKGVSSLSKDDQDRAKHYLRFEISGKLGRTVPVLLSADMEDSIKLLIKYRSNAKVHTKNPFLFGIPGYDQGRYKHLRACELMRRYAMECGADHPERLRGTQLRKQLATQCADMNIDENQVVDVANFMGHAEKIHREHYRQPVARRDICGISKLLETASGAKKAKRFEKPPEEDSLESETLEDLSLQFDSNLKRKQGIIKKVRFDPRKRRRDLESSDSEECDGPCRPEKTKRSLGAKTVRKRWSDGEKEVTLKRFSKHVEKGKLPSANELRALIDENPTLKRTPAQIRTWISNQIIAQKRETVGQ